ncbi:hypothetical protein JW926_09290, partial [Candidatus Sumerlaeota bacterium]|nr:hypothetical protein [Candidatus Sumerlaeota bacterium]
MYRKFLSLFTALFLFLTSAISADAPLTPFPFDYKPVPTVSLAAGEPLRLNLSDYTPGLNPELVTRIVYPYQDKDIIVFQSPQNPLDIAIIQSQPRKGYFIFPLLFEFTDGVKSPFFIAAEILPSNQLKETDSSKPRILPYRAQTEKSKGIDEYVFYFYDPESPDETQIDNVKALLGNERMIFNIGIQDQYIFIPIPRGEWKGKTLRVFAQNKKGVWAEEGISAGYDMETNISTDWRDSVSYFVWGTKRGEGGTPEKPFLIDNFTSSS